MAPGATGADIPLTEFCAALGAELTGAAHLSLALQDVVSHLLQTARFDPKDARTLQGLDRLSQVLGDLAAVVRILPEAWSAPQHGRLVPVLSAADVARTVRLHDVAAALIGEAILPCSHVAEGRATGQVDWL